LFKRQCDQFLLWASRDHTRVNAISGESRRQGYFQPDFLIVLMHSLQQLIGSPSLRNRIKTGSLGHLIGALPSNDIDDVALNKLALSSFKQRSARPVDPFSFVIGVGNNDHIGGMGGDQ